MGPSAKSSKSGGAEPGQSDRTDGAYPRFARETYRTAHREIGQAINGAGGLPVLVFSGEMHEDTAIDRALSHVIPDGYQNPSAAAVYTHLSAIQAAADLAGKDRVVVSIEYDEENVALLKEHALQLAYDFHAPPYLQAAAIAYLNGYELVASDPNRSAGMDSPLRYEGEIDALGRQALRTDPRAPSVVVHMGGAAHIGVLQGFTMENLENDGLNLQRSQARDPFAGIYGRSVFFNTAQDTPTTFLVKAVDMSPHYSMNPANAIQIDPPGRMVNPDELENAISNIQAASRESNGKRSVFMRQPEIGSMSGSAYEQYVQTPLKNEPTQMDRTPLSMHLGDRIDDAPLPAPKR
ncbi:MAG: hypothetical protein KDI90_12295 [Alphaproteobacteria bacterium]|nr:hypothetical protein [Alphaproteobacteria bacterium]